MAEARGHKSDYFRDMQQFMLDWCSEWPLANSDLHHSPGFDCLRILILKYFSPMNTQGKHFVFEFCVLFTRRKIRTATKFLPCVLMGENTLFKEAP